MTGLTSDKPPLSRFKNGTADTRRSMSAINCTALDMEFSHLEDVADFVRESLAANTRRAYASDISRFEKWGGRLPATPEMVATYLTAHASSHSPITLVRWLASISKAHRAIRVNDPTKVELVKSVLRGIRRRHGKAPEQAVPLTREILLEVLDAISDDPKGMRDRALLLIGFAGGFRRSELVGLDFGDVNPVQAGLILTVRRSKTDQTGIGRNIGIPFARGRHCPVKALQSWLEFSSIADGPLFRPVDRHAVIGNSRLSGEAVSLVIKDRLERVHISPIGFSGHSLRAGFVTSAAKAGIASWKIRQQTGHTSDTMLARYIRDIDIFIDNPAGTLL